MHEQSHLSENNAGLDFIQIDACKLDLAKW